MAADFPEYELGAIPPFGPRTLAELIDRRLLGYAHVLSPDSAHDRSLLVGREPDRRAGVYTERPCSLGAI
jgi:hypothetical protein